MFTGLWRDRDFLRLWSGQTASVFGSQVTFLALPLVAVITLDATPLEMGLLVALGAVPSLLIGPFAGAWIDRNRRRPLMIAADWGRAVLIGLVPLAWFLDFLSIGLLLAIGLFTGVLSLVFDVAYRSYLPSLIGRERLVEGNSKLALSRSGAEVAGPGAAGLIVQLASAPAALIADAVTFVISALSLHSIRATEVPPEKDENHGSLFMDAKDGLRAVWADPLLRALALTATTIGLFNAMFESVYLLYTVRELEVSAGLIGLISATAGGGFIMGAVIAERFIRRAGIGAAITIGALVTALSDLALPLAGGAMPVVASVLIVGQFCFGTGITVFNIGQVSLRQSATPDRLQGRMNAAFRVAMVGSVPVGALIGGLLGDAVGLRPALFIAVIGEVSAVIWLFASPVRSLRESPQPQPQV